MGFDTSELRGLAADLGKASARAVPLASAAVRKTAFDIEADAKVFCPFVTGNLQNSISTDVGVLSAEIGPTASYGYFVEVGTARMAPQPYMNPAADRREPELEKAIAQIAAGLL